MMIGDDWIADVEGGKSFGLKVVFFDVFNDNFDAEEVIVIKKLLELKETGISIERFNRIASKHYSIINKKHWLINPIYQYKFGLKVKKLIFPLNSLPFLRNFYTTATYFVLKNDK